MSSLDDPALVAAEYADESRLRRRSSVYTGAGHGADARDPLIAAVVEAAPQRILEVGCGWGELATRLADETGAEVVALDLSERMVELARGAGVDARVGDVQNLPFDDGTFDVAVAAWMLYHVPDLGRGLAELRRVLRPGGVLVAVTNSRLHLLELRELVGCGPSELSFSRESGEALLDACFERVRRVDIDDQVRFRDRAAVADYVDSSIAMSPHAGRLPPVVAEPFVASRAVSIFVATR